MSNDSSTWRTQSGYIWSLIGSAVGFANILSFSAQAYKNGGGAFLIPYFAALFVLGIPMLLLEGFVGYHWKLPLVSAYHAAIGKKGKLLGWLAVLACLTIGGFYIVLTGYSVGYVYFAATGAIPSDTQTFFEKDFLQLTGSLSDFGTLSVPLAISTLIALVVAWLVLRKSVRDGIEQVCSLFMPVLALLMIFFALVTSFLPGGWHGIQLYLTPDFSKLWNASLWRDVFGQLFFSLSLGLGIIVGYSRHTDEEIDIRKAMLYTALGDFFISFISGIAIFSCLAHLSFVQQIPFDQIVNTESTFSIGFIIFPKILQIFSPFIARCVGTLFFFSVFIAGITGVFSIIESIAGNWQYASGTTRKSAVNRTVFLLALLALLFCMGNGPHIVDALVPMVVGINMLIGGLALIAGFVYGSPTFKRSDFWNHKLLAWDRLSLQLVAPAILFVILAANILSALDHFSTIEFIQWGWLASALFLSWILASRHDDQLAIRKAWSLEHIQEEKQP